MSSPVSSGVTGGGSAYVASSRRWRAASLRRASTSRRVATVASHAGGSRGEAGVVEEHQREQAARLRLLRREGELAGEPDRLAGEVHPAGVAGRVDEVEHA